MLFAVPLYLGGVEVPQQPGKLLLEGGELVGGGLKAAQGGIGRYRLGRRKRKHDGKIGPGVGCPGPVSTTL